MPKTTTGRWTEMRERIVNTPELQAQYDRTRHELASTRRMLLQIDAERQRAGMSKAELARRIGKTPSVVRRVFSSKESNPTLGTVLNIADALGLEIELKPAKPELSELVPATALKRRGSSRKGV
ncbi:MAG: helix-turn-helix transcriptional regulator [Chloroflexi bacterium]|nr:helix-turn-helix transcriptional regulator [Chloroflexota bacterium]MDA8187069.1 helix-turn-helix transcriptional regulator [Dehalococcoidales bacterium]